MTPHLLLLLLFLFSLSNGAFSTSSSNELALTPKHPAARDWGFFEFSDNETRRRRKLGSFQLCAPCTCCGSGSKEGLCLLSPCCYAINCNIPNRPFGYCSFSPKSCDCTACSA